MYALIIILPLLSSIASGLFGWFLGGVGCSLVACVSLGLTALCSWVAFYQSVLVGQTFCVYLFPWIHSGCLGSDWALLLDPLSTSMLIVVTSVSFCVHLYSTEYMGTDPHLCRFLSYISFFTFFMVALVTADNLLQLFFGWEGVGLCSYLLISFWYTRIKATKAAMKAVLVNRVADVFIVLGLGICLSDYGTLGFATLFSVAPIHEGHIDLLCLLLFLGAMGKSAQLGLHTWLPDAMEGPTPVSALIHAATMVTAGVFLVIRCSSLFEYSNFVLSIISIVGALTAFVAATIALVQHDVKKVIAYSTCSQLGYMFFACGLSGYSVGLFHLFNHAFFKALLFLSAGSLIHGMGDEQDMRKLGGTSGIMPFTYTCILLGSLSLAGFPFLSGFYSKDFILETAIGSYAVQGIFAYWLGSFTALLTAFYSFRLIYLAFMQEPGCNKIIGGNAHEPGLKMLFPMGLLAVGSIFSGFYFKDLFIGLGSGAFGSSIFVAASNANEFGAEFAPFFYKSLPLLLSLSGTFLSLLVYSLAGKGVSIFWLRSRLLLSLLGKKWHFDSFYNRLFVLPSLTSGYQIFFRILDKGFIEQVGPTGVGPVSFAAASVIKRLQTGFLHTYVTLIVASLIFLAVI